LPAQFSTGICAAYIVDRQNIYVLRYKRNAIRLHNAHEVRSSMTRGNMIPQPIKYALHFLIIYIFDQLAHTLWNVADGTIEPAYSPTVVMIERPISGISFLVLVYIFWLFNRWFFQDEVG
jgi:hypothetical protein